MPTLDAIENEISNILDVEDNITDEEYDTYLSYLNDLYKQEIDKIDAIGFNLRKFNSKVEFLKEEEKRINNKRKSMEKRIVRFKEYIKNIMIQYDLTKLKGNTTSIYFMNTESVNVENIDDLPENYVKIKIEKHPDKKAIKQALKDGEVINGVKLLSNKSLVVR